MKHVIVMLIVWWPVVTMAQTEAKNLERFNAIEVFGPFDVELIQADIDRIVLDYNGVSADNVVAEVSRNTLKIKVRSRHYLNGVTDQAKWDRQVRVKIYYTSLQALKAQAGALVTAFGHLESDNFTVESTMGAEVFLDVQAENLNVNSSMGGVVRLGGRADNTEIRATMGGVVKGRPLQSKTASVKASMGAEVSLFVLYEVDISASLGAVVTFSGNPSVRYLTTNFGGEASGREQ